MPNPFSLNIITPAGAALIAQATAANQIVFTSALSGTTAATDAADLAGKTAAFYGGVAGAIASSSATGTVARIVAQFGNASGASPQPVKSLCILGRLASQTDGEAVIVAAMSDADSSVVLPASTAPEQALRFPFNVSIEAAEDATTVYSDGATLSDLARFVSLHKAGDPTQGEAQTVRGAKRFEDGADFGAGVGIEGELVVSDAVEMNDELLVDDQAQFNSNLHVYGELGILGDPSIDNGDLAVITQSVTPDAGSGSTLTMLLDWPYIVEDNIVFSVSAKVTCQGLEASGDAVITGTCSISGKLTVETVSEFKDDVAFNCNIYCGGFSVDADGNTDISSSVYFGAYGPVEIPGLAPFLGGASGSTLFVPLGGIIGVCPFGVDGWNLPREAGSEVTIAANAMPVAAWDAANARYSAESSGRKIPAGKYRLVTGWDYSGAGSGYGLVLLCHVQ